MCPGAHPGTGGRARTGAASGSGQPEGWGARLRPCRARGCPGKWRKLDVRYRLTPRERDASRCSDRHEAGRLGRCPQGRGRRVGRFASIPSGIYSAPGKVKRISVPLGRLGLKEAFQGPERRLNEIFPACAKSLTQRRLTRFARKSRCPPRLRDGAGWATVLLNAPATSPGTCRCCLSAPPGMPRPVP